MSKRQNDRRKGQYLLVVRRIGTSSSTWLLPDVRLFVSRSLRTGLRGENMTLHRSEAGGPPMINGAHVVIYSKDPEADRRFFRDVLHFPSVDAGHGWLIFAMPPLEVAFHDAESVDSGNQGKHELYFMCDDVAATLKDLKSKKVKVSEVSEQRWGKLASLTLPGGGKIGIYEPKHPSPLKHAGPSPS
jgi:hypothetical protein